MKIREGIDGARGKIDEPEIVNSTTRDVAEAFPHEFSHEDNYVDNCCTDVVLRRQKLFRIFFEIKEIYHNHMTKKHHILMVQLLSKQKIHVNSP